MRKKQMTLNSQNYYSRESNKEYMSVSQFKSFLDCEARTMAELDGEWIQTPSIALTVGSYVHAAFESDDVFNAFEEEHSSSIFKARGGKRSEFEQADNMIQTIKGDPLAMLVMNGEKEMILTAELFGTKWKAKLDVINHEKKRIGDLKTTQDLHKRYWSERHGGWVSFVQAYDYVLQMAMYKAITECHFEGDYKPYIVAVTKETPPNKAVIEMDFDLLIGELERAEELLPHILEVKQKKIVPTRCEKCAYCRETKKLVDAIQIDDLLA